jgi:citrate synthase
MADKDTSWTTSITEIQPNRVAVRGYDIAELMSSISFGAAVYLILRGELPDENVARLMDAVLVSSIDHGVTPPSTLAARTVASTGAALSASVAAGVLAINRHHGGAIQNCAIQLGHIARRQHELGDSLDIAAAAVLDEMKQAGERMPGFGHRIHTSDPRTARLFELAAAAGVDGPHMQAAAAVQRVFQQAGKPLPINVDGAIAAILADLGFEPSVMNGIFMIARVPGLVAHVHEEHTAQRPMRRIDPAQHRYDGPARRDMERGP